MGRELYTRMGPINHALCGCAQSPTCSYGKGAKIDTSGATLLNPTFPSSRILRFLNLPVFPSSMFTSFLVSTTLLLKKCFLNFFLTLLMHNFVMFSGSGVALGLQELVYIIITVAPEILQLVIMFPFNPLSSRRADRGLPSSPRNFSLNSGTTVVAFRWTFSSSSTGFLKWGDRAARSVFQLRFNIQ